MMMLFFSLTNSDRDRCWYRNLKCLQRGQSQGSDNRGDFQFCFSWDTGLHGPCGSTSSRFHESQDAEQR
ncbi:hypothetical protein ACS0TY_021924 [Phlomoides rotata]